MSYHFFVADRRGYLWKWAAWIFIKNDLFVFHRKKKNNNMWIWSDMRVSKSFSFGDIQMCAAIWWVRWSPYPTLTLSSLKACQSEEDLRCTLVSPYPTGEMSITAFSTQALRLTPALSDPPNTHTYTESCYQGTCKDASPPPCPTGLLSSLLFVPVNEREKLEKLPSILSALSFLSMAESVPLSGSVFYWPFNSLLFFCPLI